MPDIFTLTVQLDPMASEERVKLVNAIGQLRGVKDVETHVWYSREGKVKEVQPKEFGYWETLIEFVNRDPTIPLCSRRKISEGMPEMWKDNVLFVSHPDAPWANDRFSKTLSRLLQGLCSGGRIEFIEVKPC